MQHSFVMFSTYKTRRVAIHGMFLAANHLHSDNVSHSMNQLLELVPYNKTEKIDSFSWASAIFEHIKEALE